MIRCVCFSDLIISIGTVGAQECLFYIIYLALVSMLKYLMMYGEEQGPRYVNELCYDHEPHQPLSWANFPH